MKTAGWLLSISLALGMVVPTFPTWAAKGGNNKFKTNLNNDGVEPDAKGWICKKTTGQGEKFLLRASRLDSRTPYFLVINGAILDTLTSSPGGVLMLKSLPGGAPSIDAIDSLAIWNSASNSVLSVGTPPAQPTGSVGGSLTVTNVDAVVTVTDPTVASSGVNEVDTALNLFWNVYDNTVLQGCVMEMRVSPIITFDASLYLTVTAPASNLVMSSTNLFDGVVTVSQSFLGYGSTTLYNAVVDPSAAIVWDASGVTNIVFVDASSLDSSTNSLDSSSQPSPDSSTP
jgi:hypothetical protein